MSDVIAFKPREFPEVSIDRDTVIFTTNHLGADMQGDAGIDAQYLADVSGHTVIGLNRIGSGDGAKYSKTLAQQLTHEPDNVTDQWLDKVTPALRASAPSRVELVGRSAGANLMLNIAAHELIPETSGILAIEALRLQRVSTRIGQLKYIHYQLRREGIFGDSVVDLIDADLPPLHYERPEIASNPWKMARRQLIDIRHYQHLWASDLPFQNALQIAGNVDISSLFLFAQETMAADTDKLEMYLNVIRTARDISGLLHSLQTDVVPKTTHGSFDDQRLYATQYRRFVALAGRD